MSFRKVYALANGRSNEMKTKRLLIKSIAVPTVRELALSRYLCGTESKAYTLVFLHALSLVLDSVRVSTGGPFLGKVTLSGMF